MTLIPGGREWGHWQGVGIDPAVSRWVDQWARTLPYGSLCFCASEGPLSSSLLFSSGSHQKCIGGRPWDTVRDDRILLQKNGRLEQAAASRWGGLPKLIPSNCPKTSVTCHWWTIKKDFPVIFEGRALLTTHYILCFTIYFSSYRQSSFLSILYPATRWWCFGSLGEEIRRCSQRRDWTILVNFMPS